MKPLLVLIGTFVLGVLFNKIFRGNYDFLLSARIAMAFMLVFTAVGHFVFTKGMSMMLPDFIPYKSAVVYFTGIIEIAAAIGLFVPGMRLIVGWMLIAFFILVLPANIHAAIQKVDFQQGTLEGKGIEYLWFRVPLQILFILWTYLTTIKTDWL